MKDKSSDKADSGFDIVGLGKTAEAIPKEVYIEASRGLIDTFSKIVAPITETTSGIGRYIRQKFDNMVEVEKALAAFTIQNAVEKAKRSGNILIPKHTKSFITSFEEASKETNPILHEMWENIIANQITDSNFHPRYVNILSTLSADEANLLMQLNTVDNIGEGFSVYFGSPRDGFDYFLLKCRDKILHKWSYSCNILLDSDLAGVLAPTDEIYEKQSNVTIVYLTSSGKRFLDAVTTNSHSASSSIGN